MGTPSERVADVSQASSIGQWTAPFFMPIDGLHAHLLPTGKVWFFGYNDGSFMYTGANGGVNRRTDGEGVKTDMGGYGSMTYAGIKSFILCGVGRDDPRVRKGLEWVSKNYSVDVNPGRQEGAGGQGYYYYLVSMARCFDALGVDEITDAAGKQHDWRAEITRALANRQRKDGSWGNDFGTWMEGDPNLDTAYALIALSYTRPKK